MNAIGAVSDQTFAGRWLDGRSVAPQEVRCTIGAELVLDGGPGVELRRYPLSAVVMAEPLAKAPRLIDLPDGSVLAIEETPALAAALAAAGHRESRVVVWQRAWPAAMVALVLLLAGAAWLYFVGLQRAADWAAARVPASLEVHMGDQALAAIDHGVYGPSALSAAEQKAIDERLLAFEAKAGIPPTRRLEFRSAAGGEGINAFSLPGDTIVVLDGLVAFTGQDNEMLMAVLAHEAGHQSHHHMTRSLFRALGGGALAGLIWGDYSSVASNSAILLGQLSYSRDDEREADDFAIAALRRAGISPVAAARFYRKLKGDPSTRGGGVPQWASTHPDSDERERKALDAAEDDDEAASAPPR